MSSCPNGRVTAICPGFDEIFNGVFRLQLQHQPSRRSHVHVRFHVDRALTDKPLPGNSRTLRSKPASQVIASCAEPRLQPVSKVCAIDVAALYNLEGLEHLQEVILAKRPVRVEIDSGFVVKGNRHVQAPAGLNYTLQFLNRPFRPMWLDRVTIATQAYMLDHAEAR